MGAREDIERQWRHGGVLVRLIIVNVAVFLVYHAVLFAFHLVGAEQPGLITYLASGSFLPWLMRRPWTVVTYMFTHEAPMHLFWNMVMLWTSGRLFADLLGERRLLGNYLLGGLSGFALYALCANVAGLQRYAGSDVILGASAAVMGVFIGIAAFRPEMEVHLMFFGAVRLKYLAFIVLLLDLIGIRQGNNTGGHIAHLGGALYGYLAATRLKQGSDWSLRFVDALARLAGVFARPRMRVAKSSKRRMAVYATEGTDGKRARQERVDSLLDKINRSGYDSLNKEEKDFLFRASNEQ
jgi:membrane associated rhomboid family serine protease